MVALQKSKWTVKEWLAAVVDGRKPNGKTVEATRVSDGDVVEVWYSGGQHFGSGGFGASALYAGNEPEFVAPADSHRTSFISESSARFRLTAPCVVYEYSGDAINEGRQFRNHAIVCATDEQIVEAQKIIAEQRQNEAEAADPAALKEFLKRCWAISEDHVRRYHSGGCCWAGRDGCPRERWIPSQIYGMLEKGEPDEAYLAGLNQDVAAAIRQALAEETPEERLTVWHEAKAEREAEKKAEGKAFARRQHEKLVAMGFGPEAAGRVMRASGPGRCLEAIEWARYAFATVGSADALDCLLSGAGGTNGFGWDRMAAALEAFGLEPPSANSSGAFFRLLDGARAAIAAGLPTTDAGA